MKRRHGWGAFVAGLAVAAGCTGQATAASTQPALQAAKARAADWSGRYRYEFSDGANAAGTAVIVSYELVITPKSCRLRAEGYQTDETILCGVTPRASGIEITFKSYGDGGVTDKYGNAVYSVGDPLFALERRGGKLLTRWKGYPLPDDKAHPAGMYFRRVR